MGLRVRTQLPGGHCRMTCGSVSPRESLYKLSAGTSRWPSAKSAVSLMGWGWGVQYPWCSWGEGNMAMQAFSVQDWILAVLADQDPWSPTWSRSHR